MNERIKQLEERLFRIQMVDRWTSEDRRMYEEITEELRVLRGKE